MKSKIQKDRKPGIVTYELKKTSIRGSIIWRNRQTMTSGERERKVRDEKKREKESRNVSRQIWGKHYSEEQVKDKEDDGRRVN